MMSLSLLLHLHPPLEMQLRSSSRILLKRSLL
jgi:hypothetical protein